MIAAMTTCLRALLAWGLFVSTCVGQSLPDRILVGYWHNWGGSLALRLSQVPEEYDVVNIAFATPTTPAGATMQFSPAVSMYSGPQQFRAEVAALQARGVKVLISIGGGADPVHVTSPAEAQSFASSMAQIVNTYGFDGVDIDLEGSSLTLNPGDRDLFNPTSPRIVHFISGMQQLLQQIAPGAMLTAAPETAFVQGGMSSYGGVWGAYLPVLEALRDRLTYLHVQHYNTGTMFGSNGRIYTPGTEDFHVAMADALIGGFTISGGQFFAPFEADRVAIGLPASTSAAGSGYTSPAVIHRALDRLLLGVPASGYTLARPAGYPSFRGLMTWSINWDVQTGQAFSRPHRGYLDSVFLSVSTSSISAATGGTAVFGLRGGRANAGGNYYLLTSLSGTSPGTPLPGGRVLPLNLDPMTTLALQPGAASVFSGFTGTLDSRGEATARFVLPGATGVPPAEFSFAFLRFPPWGFASTSAAVNILP